MSRTKIAIAGALGRMGNNLINSALSNNNVELVGVFDVKILTLALLIKIKFKKMFLLLGKNHLKKQI